METTYSIHVEPTPSHTISLSSNMTTTGGDFIRTSMSRGIEMSSVVRESRVRSRASSVQSTVGVSPLLSSRLVTITSTTTPGSMDSVTQNPHITDTEAEVDQ